MALTADAAILEVGGDADSPYLELRTSGPYVDTCGTPAGSWSVAVERDGDEVLSTQVPQAAGSESELLALGSVARPDTELLVTTNSSPEWTVAPGASLLTPGRRPITLEIPHSRRSSS